MALLVLLKYLDRTATPEPEDDVNNVSSLKRSLRSTASIVPLAAAKRPRTQGEPFDIHLSRKFQLNLKCSGPTTLRSTFVQTRPTQLSAQPFDAVILQRAVCTVGKATGEVDITCPAENDENITGRISQVLFASGTTKNIYKASSLA